jgi:hypothetical protein
MRTQAALQVEQLDHVELGVLLAVLVVLAAFGFYQGFRRLWKARVIEDAPTAKVRSAHQGYVELVGEAQAMRGEPIVAPLSKATCCWYRYTIEKKSGKEWNLVRKEVSDGLFLLRDETGECIVDPEGAEVTPRTRQVWHGDGDEPLLVVMPPRGAEGVQIGPVVMRSTAGSFTGRHRYTEELILPGEPLYVLGAFKTLDDIDHHQSRSEITSALLRDWKRDWRRLLHRFDHNRDGQIDAAEWEDARRVAEREAQQQHAEQVASQHQHTIRRPAERGRPFLLSTLPQVKLARRYRWQAVGGMFLFLVAGGALVWISGLRLW